MSRFAKYLGYITVKIEDEEIEVRPTLRHKQQLLGIQQNAKKGLSEADWARQHTIFKQILKTNDPEATDAELEAFLIEHDMNFMMALYVGFGWAKEEDLADLKGELRKKAVDSLDEN